MAVRRVPLPVLLVFSVLLVASADDSDMSDNDVHVLQLVNDYRTQVVGIPTLTTNEAASCVGHKIASRFVDRPCTNATADDTQFSDFPNMLASCHVNFVNATTGYIALNCVPVAADSSDASSIAGRNFTTVQQYQKILNDSDFTSAGVGSDGIWYALVLAKSSPDGNYGVTEGLNGAVPRATGLLPLVLGCLLVSLAVLYGMPIL